MAINKVEYGGETLIDLTNDTVSEQTLVTGTTAHAANGEQITGTFDPSVYLEKTGDASNTTVAFAQASARANITTGEKMSTIFGKIKKFFADLKSVAFTGSASDLTTGTLGADRLPSIPVEKLSGTISSANLPSYVDDVLEYAGKANFPAKGEAGKIYVDTTTNLTYRWSGTDYVEISPSLALGTTSATAYRGDYGNIAYQHSQSTGNPHSTTAADIGLGNVDNTADADKSVKYATSAGNATKVNNHTVNADVPSGAKFTDTNTWRGIQNNLTSDSTSDSLSAAQGKVLKAAIDKNASDIDTLNNNLLSQQQSIKNMNIHISGYDAQPPVDCLKEHFDELPDNTVVSGIIHAGSAYFYAGYKISNGDYAAFIVFYYNGRTIQHITKNKDIWDVY